MTRANRTAHPLPDHPPSSWNPGYGRTKSESHQGFKVRDARRWLEDGNKVRVRIRFRGREIDYVDLALVDLRKVAELLSDISAVEQPPAMEGRSVMMVLTPVKGGKKKSETVEQPAQAE